MGGLITKDDTYGYIGQFIEYLRQIVEIILMLFRGSDTKTESDKNEEAAQ